MRLTDPAQDIFVVNYSSSCPPMLCWCFSEALLGITLRVRVLNWARVLLRNTTLLDVAAEREWKAKELHVSVW